MLKSPYCLIHLCGAVGRLSGRTGEIDAAVKKRFKVTDTFRLEADEFEYDVNYEKESKTNFVLLYDDLDPLGYRPELSGGDGDYKLLVRKVTPPSEHRSRLPVIFALFTLVTVIAFGFLSQDLYDQLDPGFVLYPVLPTVVLSLVLLLGVQEVARMYVANNRKSGSSTKYLIPGIPFLPPFLPLPSLGYVNIQRTPALNRDSTFDAALVGPLVLLAFSVVLYVVGDLTTVQSTVPLSPGNVANSTIFINPSIIQIGLDAMFAPSLQHSAQGIIPLSAIGNVATVGFILAFASLLPMVPFSGGRMSALVLGERAGVAATYLSIILLLTLDTPNYWALAIVSLVLAGRPTKQRFFDEVSTLSSSRRWVFVGAVALALLAVPLPHNVATFVLG